MSESKGLVRSASKAYGYNYTALADIVDAGYTLPKMKTVTEDEKEYLYWYDTELKEWIRGAQIVIPKGMKMNDAQIYGSALTYARRYTAFMALQLASADDKYFEAQEPSKEETATDKQIEDARAQMFAADPECATEAQITYLRRLYTPEEIIKVCARNKWQDITKIPFDKAKTMIEVRNK